MVRRQTEEFIAKTQADELILTSMMFDHQARRKSMEIAARLMTVDAAA